MTIFIIMIKLVLTTTLMISSSVVGSDWMGADVTIPDYDHLERRLVGYDAWFSCGVNVTNYKGNIQLIRLYRNNSETPLYSVDARHTSLHEASHATNLGEGRVKIFLPYFLKQPQGAAVNEGMEYSRVHGDSLMLQLQAVGRDDSGSYDCSVDYSKHPTLTTTTFLHVLEPPQYIDIRSSLSSYGLVRDKTLLYPVGLNLTLRCIVTGGSPRPQVSWSEDADLELHSSNTQVSSDTTSSISTVEVDLGELRRSDDGRKFSCRADSLASKAALCAPLISDVTVRVAAPPIVVSMKKLVVIKRNFQVTNPENVSSTYTLLQAECEAVGGVNGRPLEWSVDGAPLERMVSPDRYNISSRKASTEKNVFVSTLMIAVTSSDRGRSLQCKSPPPFMEGLMDSLAVKQWEDAWQTVTVSYDEAPIASIALSPSSNVIAVGDGNVQYVRINDNVSMKCVASGYPKPDHIQWYLNGAFIRMENPDPSLVYSSEDYDKHALDVLQSSERDGLYVYENPASAEVLEESSEGKDSFENSIHLTQRKSFPKLTEKVNENFWQFEGVYNGYVISRDGTQSSTLTVANFARKHSGAYRCKASNRAGAGESSPLVIKTAEVPKCHSKYKLIVYKTHGEAVTVTCNVYSRPKPNNYSWEFSEEVEVLSSSHTNSVTVRLSGVSTLNGSVNCSASNIVGSSEEQCQARIVYKGPPYPVQYCVQSLYNSTVAGSLGLHLTCEAGITANDVPTNYTLHVEERLRDPPRPSEERDELGFEDDNFTLGNGMFHGEVVSAVSSDRNLSFYIDGMQSGFVYLISIYARNQYGRSTSLTFEFDPNPLADASYQASEELLEVGAAQFSIITMATAAMAFIAVTVLVGTVVVIALNNDKQNKDKLNSSSDRKHKRSYAKDAQKVVQTHSYFNFRADIDREALLSNNKLSSFSSAQHNASLTSDQKTPPAQEAVKNWISWPNQPTPASNRGLTHCQTDDIVWQKQESENTDTLETVEIQSGRCSSSSITSSSTASTVVPNPNYSGRLDAIPLETSLDDPEDSNNQNNFNVCIDNNSQLSLKRNEISSTGLEVLPKVDYPLTKKLSSRHMLLRDNLSNGKYSIKLLKTFQKTNPNVIGCGPTCQHTSEKTSPVVKKMKEQLEYAMPYDLKDDIPVGVKFQISSPIIGSGDTDDGKETYDITYAELDHNKNNKEETDKDDVCLQNGREEVKTDDYLHARKCAQTSECNDSNLDRVTIGSDTSETKNSMQDNDVNGKLKNSIECDINSGKMASIKEKLMHSTTSDKIGVHCEKPKIADSMLENMETVV